jgi:XTP/dITP diphosphohydrolase
VRARLASGNAHKLAELRAALAGWDLDLVDIDVEEDGATYEDNARLKARAGREAAPADAWVLGEDSGIESDALAGGPGVQSARWAPAGERANSLVARLADEPNRRGRMVCTIVALGPGGEEVVVMGVLPGEIARERRGTGGFGYDPVFIPEGEQRTVAELGDDWKRANSHRARAARALVAETERLVPDTPSV